MKTLKRWFLVVTGIGLVALLLVGTATFAPVFAQGPGGMMGQNNHDGVMLGGYGPGMMGYNRSYTGPMPFAPGMMGGCEFGGIRGGMMNGGMMGGGMMHGGMMGGGMMGNLSPLFTPDPLTLAEATEAVNTYLTGLNDSNLAVGEVMIFDNHAYAQIVAEETGIGVMEVLVDPVTQAIYPEMGPNMMWNLKYGMMTDSGSNGMMDMMGGGQFGANPMMGNAGQAEISAEMPLTADEAVEIAQAYLDAYVNNNLEADEHVDPFYGYYTLHVKRDGETIGMLSVNGYSRQVFLHTWHGDLLEMSGE